MLIEALSRLAEKAGATSITLTIPPSDGGNCSVMVVPCLGQSALTADDEAQGRLLAALTSPLVVSGNVGELDRRLVRLLDDIEAGYVEASAKLPETDAQRKKRELKEAAAKRSDSKDKADSGDDGAESAEDGEHDTAKSHAEALAEGEADSL